MIKALHSDAEGPLAQEGLYLISIADVISHDDLVISFVVVEAEVVLTLWLMFGFLAVTTHVVNLRIIYYLCVFIRTQCHVL